MPSWNSLKRLLSEEFEIEKRVNTDFLAAGRMYLHGTSQSFVVKIIAYESGLVANRFLLGWLFGRIWIPWETISHVTEYAMSSDRACIHTDAILHLRSEAVPPLAVPWRKNFNEFLPDSIGYEDRTTR